MDFQTFLIQWIYINLNTDCKWMYNLHLQFNKITNTVMNTPKLFVNNDEAMIPLDICY